MSFQDNLLTLLKGNYQELLEIFKSLDNKTLYDLCKSKNEIAIEVCKQEPYLSRVRNYGNMLRRRISYEDIYFNIILNIFHRHSSNATKLYLYYYYYLTEKNIEKLPNDHNNISPIEIDKIIRSLFSTHGKVYDIINHFSDQYETYINYASKHYYDDYGKLDIYYTPEPVTGEYFYEDQENLVNILEEVRHAMKPSWLYNDINMVDPVLLTEDPIEFTYLDNRTVYTFEDSSEALDTIKEIASLYYDN